MYHQSSTLFCDNLQPNGGASNQVGERGRSWRKRMAGDTPITVPLMSRDICRIFLIINVFMGRIYNAFMVSRFEGHCPRDLEYVTDRLNPKTMQSVFCVSCLSLLFFYHLVLFGETMTNHSRIQRH